MSPLLAIVQTSAAPKNPIPTPPARVLSAAEDARHEDLMRAHGKHLIERQRLSGVRARRASTGCYSIYDAAGHHIGRTSAPDAYTGVDAAALKTAAWRMALSEEMLEVCRQLDADVEFTGAVAAATVDQARALLAKMAAV